MRLEESHGCPFNAISTDIPQVELESIVLYYHEDEKRNAICHRNYTFID